MKKLLLLFLFIFTSPVFGSGIESNTASAPCTNNTLETYSGNSNLQADWQPNTINLRWYNENERLTVQSSAQSCIYDGTLTIPSTQPTRTGYTFAGWEVRLPGAYTELEYLQGTDTQWIDTNYFPNNNTGIKTKIQFDSIENNHASIFGGATSGNRGFECFHWDSVVVCYYGATGLSTTPVNLNDFLEIDWNKNRFNYKVNNGDVASRILSTQTFTEQSKMVLFGLSRGGTVVAKSNIKMYYFKLYDNNELIHNFIPARRNSDNKLGMYDTVTKTFFTNAGTGTFIAGPAVQ